MSHLEDGFTLGLIIGAAAVVIAAVVYGLSYKTLAARVLGALRDRGASAAMGVLDHRAPALGKISLTKIIVQRERMAALALVGNVDALEREIAGHQGSVSAVAQVNAVAMLGMALRADASSAADMLNRLALWTEAEGGRALGLVKKKVRAMATLAAAVAGTPVPTAAWPELEKLAREGGMLATVVSRAIELAHVRAGNDAAATEWHQRVSAKTQVFDHPPAA